MKKIFYPCLCFLNFFPLWLVVMFRDYLWIFIDGHVNVGAEWCGLIGLPLCILITGLLVWIGVRQKCLSDVQEKKILTRIEEQKMIVSDILLSYVLPLLVFDFASWRGLIEASVFVIALMIICWKYNAVQGYVCLSLAGARFYRCWTSDSKQIEVLSWTPLNGEVGSELEMCLLNDSIWVVCCCSSEAKSNTTNSRLQ